MNPDKTFQIGDRVCVTTPLGGRQGQIGVVTVIDTPRYNGTSRPYPYLVKFSDHTSPYHFAFEELELVASASAPTEPQKPGRGVGEKITDAYTVEAGDWVVLRYADHEFEGLAYYDGLTTSLAGRKVGPENLVEAWRVAPPAPPILTKPGTTFYATVRGVPDVKLMVQIITEGTMYYVSPTRAGDYTLHRAKNIDPSTIRDIRE